MNTTTRGGNRLDRTADEELNVALDTFRRALLDRAEQYAENENESISGDHIQLAYKSIYAPDPALRSAQRIVSLALYENRIAELIAYGMASALFALGFVLVLIGVFASSANIRVTGIATGTLFELLLLAPIRFATNVRRHNIAIRMLALVLDRVEDPKTLSQVLSKNFKEVLIPTTSGLK